jgi:sporulation-control protein
MSFFNKILASAGIGSAKVDTLVDQAVYVPGEELSGVMRIKGGKIDQEIGKIDIELKTEYIVEHDDKKTTTTCCIARIKVSDGFHLEQGQELEIPFSFRLPLETPVTHAKQPVWLETALDIGMALDPTDRDSLKIEPHPYMNTVFEAVHLLGFRFRSSSCERHPKLGRSVPFVQEFEFTPGSEYARDIEELELVMQLEPEGVHVLVEVDRRGRGLSGWLESAFDMDERHAWLSLSREELSYGPDHIADALEELIDRQIR